jgi:hypothetical protein
MIVDFERDKISFGGKLVDKGETKNPIKFQIRTKFQQPYKGTSEANAEKTTARDTVKYHKVDKNKGSCGIFESIDFSDEAKFGPLTFIEVEMKNYMNYGLTFRSQGNLPLLIENPEKVSSPPMDGFVIVMEHDPAIDPKCEARMVFELK